MTESGYEHYEISNFARPGMKSRHNTSYWQQKKYLGLGPSAHSFNGTSRQWNIANNALYISSVLNGFPSFELEELSIVQRINEYIMTSLRTMEGLDLNKIPGVMSNELRAASKKFLESGKVILKENKLLLTREGKLFADGIAADLFIAAG
jgi:oxygen-independent coproporphyrinogen-3 oxidase